MKTLVLILTSIISMPAYSEKLIVSRTNHSGVTLVDYMEQNKTGYYLSGYALGTSLSPKAKNTWDQTFGAVMKLKNRKIANSCDTGRYKILFQDVKNKSHVYEGCYSDEPYRQIIKNIKSLRKDAQRKSLQD